MNSFIRAGKSFYSNGQRITSEDWVAKVRQFREAYASKHQADRIKAFQLIEPLWGNFVKDRDSREAVQMMLDVLNKETDIIVAETAVSCTARIAVDTSALQWLSRDYKKILLSETARLRLIKSLGLFASGYNEALTILIDLANDEQSTSKLRRAVIDSLSKLPEYLAAPAIVKMAADRDVDVAMTALACLTTIKSAKSISNLIDMIGTEKRIAVKAKIIETLETVTGQKHGPDMAKWRNWWETSTEIPPEEIKAAIERGRDYILKQYTNTVIQDELTFYAVIHATPIARENKNPPDPAGPMGTNQLIQSSLDYLLDKKLGQTYNVALLAMTLCYLDKTKYQNRIIQCAQFLIANESVSGNWTYGAPVPSIETTPSSPAKTIITPSTDPKPGSETSSVKKPKFKIPPRRKDPGFDNSNTQYALLGLRACAEAGVEIPKEVWQDAEKHLLRTQAGDGGWCYTTGTSYGSMTAGGLGGLAICKYYLGQKVAEDANIKKAEDWLAKNFTVFQNPCYGVGTSWHYYYLYGLERAGTLAGSNTFGAYNWYQHGARYLIIEQNPDGGWNKNPQDTCFAMLFLSRATKPLTPLKVIITPD